MKSLKMVFCQAADFRGNPSSLEKVIYYPMSEEFRWKFLPRSSVDWLFQTLFNPLNVS